MPNELPLPDDLQKLIEKRSGKERRRRSDSRGDEDDGSRRAGPQKDRRQNKNYRDLLYDDDDE